MKFVLKQALFIIFALSVNPVFAAVKASINQTTVFEGDPVTLTIETSENNHSQPNLTPLKKDFDVLEENRNSQISILNGRRSFKKIWSIELQPKLKGEITIPEISVGKDKTQALILTIKTLPPEVMAETRKHIFIESSIDISSDETYVQQQIPYTVKLFYDATMQSGEIYSPKVKNANIRQLSDDRKYQVIRGGKKFIVLEKHFVISAEKSGKLHIPATSVKGRIALSGGDSPRLRRRMDETAMLNQFFNDFTSDPFFRSPFDRMFNRRRSVGPSRPFSISSKTIDVNILPVPASFTGSAWLPAEDLLITDSWATKPAELKVGEPVTRTLVLQVKGLASSQIPKIHIPKPAGIKVYPEQARTDTPNDGNTVYGIQRIDITYIPNKEGSVTIPEIAVDWWDIKNKKQQTFTLPEWNLVVAAGAVGSNAPSINNEPMSDANPESEKQTLNTEQQNNPKQWNVKIVAATIGVLLLLFSAIFTHFKKKQRNKHSLKQRSKPVSIKKLQSSLSQACQKNNKHLSARLLLKFTRALWNDSAIQNLGMLASQLNQGTETIKELEKSLYAADSAKWDGKELQILIEKGIQQKQKNHTLENEGLAPLYPV